jgi:serine/threonine protein kinase
MVSAKHKIWTGLLVILTVSVRSIWKSLALFSESDLSYVINPSRVEHESDDDKSSLGRPRIVALDIDESLSISFPHNKTTTPSRRQRKRTLPYPMSSFNNNLTTATTFRDFETDWFTKCQPEVDISIRPTCNVLHELDSFQGLDISLLSMEGSWRSVWKVQNANTNTKEDPLILKLLHLQHRLLHFQHREFDTESYALHAMDSFVMEQISASPYVVGSFGFCGQSIVTEFAKTSGTNTIKDPKLSWESRVRLARDLARGLAELHALSRLDWRLDFEDTHSNHTTTHQQQQQLPLQFAHYDINLANTVSLHSKTIQWNDFNLGVVSRTRTRKNDNGTNTSSSSCPVPIRYKGPLWRSPEEIQNTTGHVPQLHPSDVYSLGSLMFTTMTKHQPWTNLEEGDRRTMDDIAAKKAKGELPNVPLRHQPQRQEAKVLWQATRACFRLDPTQRPTAYQLAVALGTAYDWFRKKRKPTDQAIEELFAVKGTYLD